MPLYLIKLTVSFKVVPLINVEELKAIKRFEALFLLTRVMPYKCQLLPDYKIDWGYKVEDSKFELRK